MDEVKIIQSYEEDLIRAREEKDFDSQLKYLTYLIGKCSEDKKLLLEKIETLIYNQNFEDAYRMIVNNIKKLPDYQQEIILLKAMLKRFQNELGESKRILNQAISQYPENE